MIRTVAPPGGDLLVRQQAAVLILVRSQLVVFMEDTTASFMATLQQHDRVRVRVWPNNNMTETG